MRGGKKHERGFEDGGMEKETRGGRQKEEEGVAPLHSRALGPTAVHRDTRGRLTSPCGSLNTEKRQGRIQESDPRSDLE